MNRLEAVQSIKEKLLHENELPSVISELRELLSSDCAELDKAQVS